MNSENGAGWPMPIIPALRREVEAGGSNVQGHIYIYIYAYIYTCIYYTASMRLRPAWAA